MGLRQALCELGYVEGQNLVIEFRSPEGKRERQSEIAAELVRLKVDVIVIPGSPAIIRVVQGATRTIPIVMVGIRINPVEAGFVASLARPGGNITGITNLETDLHPKRLELPKETVPRISRVAILWPRYQQRNAMKEIEAAGQALGIQIQSVVREGGPVSSFESAFSTISREHSDGLIVATFASTLRHQERIIDFVAEQRLPTMYSRNEFVDAGGLMSYATAQIELFRRAATYVDRILKGAKPADLPVERPTKFELVINLKTAKQLGVMIPGSVLFQADRVIR
jgi:putative ABC transport system substrate-binding protein